MSGHSKWSKIKRKKEMKDEQRGRIFSKLARMITLAVKEGGGISSPDKNIKLRLAIERAKEYNLPKENIQRAIEKAKISGQQEFKEVVYEGFGPGGVSLIILATTDNPNRTLSEIRRVLEQTGGKLGSAGSVLYNFEKCGIVVFNKQTIQENMLLQLIDKLQAKDVKDDENNFVLYIPFGELGHVEKNINQDFPRPTTIDIFYRPLTTIDIADKEIADKIFSLVETLEELDDVHKVYVNSSFSL